MPGTASGQGSESRDLGRSGREASMGKRGQQQGPPGLGQGRDKDAGWASTGWFMGNKRLCLKLGGGMQESGEGKPSKVAGSIVEPLAC